VGAVVLSSSSEEDAVAQEQGREQGPVRVSVVIPAFNAAATLGAQLEALAAQEAAEPFEVVVADNGSTDGTADVVRSYAERMPLLRLVDASERTGSNVARNAGVRAARGELVLMCDADDVVAPGWVDALVGALGSADAVGGHLDRTSLNPDLLRIWPDYEGHSQVTVQLGFLPRPVGANAGFRRAVWEELGGFDERYVRGGTETEFFWRLQLAGHTLVDVPGAVVAYRMRTTEKAMVRQMYIWGRQAPMLYRDFRAAGMPWRPSDPVRSWVWALRLAARVRGRGSWLRLRRHLAYLLGRVVGSATYRVLYL
jgi:glycosyltransferase involved in cell wall biosynthesis